MPIPEPIQSALEGAGISASALDRIRLARGLVGKTSYVAGVALLVLGAIALRGDAPAWVLAALTVFIFSVYFGGILWFAHRLYIIGASEGTADRRQNGQQIPSKRSF